MDLSPFMLTCPAFCLLEEFHTYIKVSPFGSMKLGITALSLYKSNYLQLCMTVIGGDKEQNWDFLSKSGYPNARTFVYV